LLILGSMLMLAVALHYVRDARLLSPPVKVQKGGRGTPFRIDLSTANTAELMLLPEIGRKRAEQIVKCRPFKSVDDLLAIPGITKALVERLRRFVCVGSPSSETTEATRKTPRAERTWD